MHNPTIKFMFRADADDTLRLVYATQGAAGFDLAANLLPADREGGLELPAGEVILVPTGLHVEIPLGLQMEIRSRSGASYKGLVVRNQPGTIDSDYRGEVMVMLENRTPLAVVIHHGERVAQGVIMPAIQARFDNVQALSETGRGAGGFGSTGTGAAGMASIPPAPDTAAGGDIVQRIMALPVTPGGRLRLRHVKRGTLYDVTAVLTPFLLGLNDEDRVSFRDAFDTAMGVHPGFDMLRHAVYKSLGCNNDDPVDIGVQTDGGHHIAWALYIPAQVHGADLPDAWLRPVVEFAGGRFEIVSP